MPKIKKKHYGNLPNDDNVDVFKLENKTGIEVKILTYGGIISSIKVPDTQGNFENMVLGFETLEGYLNNNAYLGAIVGRYANRIANAKFMLDGKEYSLTSNLGKHHLHGGTKGFDKVIWDAKTAINDHKVSLILNYHSLDMEEGYPGNLNVTVTYSLTDDNIFDIEYKAVTDSKTVINLTQHSYFNLSGDFKHAIHDHEIQILADYYLPMDNESIPLGILKKVDNTSFDFKKSKPIGEDINDNHQQLKIGNGYDHCWVLNGDGSYRKVAETYHPLSGRLMEVFTTEPGMQFYTGNFLNEKDKGKILFGPRSGFCLETQHFPDSPNQSSFPSVVLEPDKTYYSKTAIKFAVK